MADNRVILKKSSVASKVPTTSDLEFGELAVNYTDGKIYYKDSSNNIRFFEETNSFQNVDVSGQTTLTADGGSDTLTFTEGQGITITTDGTTNELTITASGSAGNDFVNSASFNTINGELTLTRTDSGTVVVDLDGRFLLQGAKAADADLLDGQEGTYYLNYNNFTNTPTLYASSDFDTDFGSKSTSDLSEGTNLYYTDTRVRNALSASGDLSYDSVTGTFSYTERTDQDIRNLFSASGDLSYDSATGTFSVTVPAGYDSTDFDTDFSGKSTDNLSEGTTNLYYLDSRVDSHLSGGTGVSYSSGAISIGQPVGTADNVEFNDVVVGGNLTVSGTTTTVNTETLDIADNNITLNSNYSGSSPTENGGITVNRGTVSDVVLQWNETNDYWEIASGGTTGRILTTGDEGSGNGLDADLLDGQDGTYYLNYNNFSNTPTIGNGTLTVSGGSGLTGSGTFNADQSTNSSVTINHADTSAQSSVNGSGNTFIQDVTLDGFGHVTGLGTATVVIPDTANDATITVSAGTGLSGGGNFTTDQATNETITVNHADTSTQGSVNNSGSTVIQDVTLDAFGHVINLNSKNLSASDVGALGVNDKADDSDLLDGLNSSQFLRSDTSDTMSGNLDVNGRLGAERLVLDNSELTSYSLENGLIIFDQAGDNNLNVYNTNLGRWVQIWDDSNDGSGSGLDADKLDGQHASAFLGVNDKADDADKLDGLNSSQFLRSDTNDTMSGRLEMSNVLDMNNNDIQGVDQIFHHGDTNTYIQFHASDQWRVVTGGAERLEVNNSQVTVQNANFNVDDGDVRSRGAGFRNATGNYGTIRVDDDRSVNWAGYAIRDDWVFMSDGSSRSGIYNDTDNEWAIEFNRNGSVEVKYNGSNRLVTTSSGVSVSGDVSASSFSGDGSGLTNVPVNETDTLDSVTDRGNSTSNTISAGEVESDLFFRNKDTVTSNRTVPNDGYNSMSVGPITISDGTTITVQDGARWVVI